MRITKEDLGRRIRKLRRDREMSQSELAARAGMSENLIWNYEHGNYMPPADKTFALAQVLGCTVDELLGWSDPVPA